MVFTGILKSVDGFLNMRIEQITQPITHPALNNLKVVSFRGSSIKHIEMNLNEEIDQKLSQATYLALALNNK